MKRLFLAATLLFFCIFCPASLVAGAKVDGAGREWLNAQKDPPAINVNGDWDSDEFGQLHLSQAEGAREVIGVTGSYEITGVVSGKSLYLLLSSGHTVEYCAVLSSQDGRSFMGKYANRRSRLKFGTGLCQESTRPIYLKKQ